MEEKKKQLHPERKYPYFWKFQYEDGFTKIIGSKENKAPYGTANRISTQNKYGRITNVRAVPPEAAKHIDQPIDTNKYDYLHSEDMSQWEYMEGCTCKLCIDTEKVKNEKVYSVRIPQELSPDVIDDVRTSITSIIEEEEADEELIGHIITVQTRLAKITRGVDKFFNLVADAEGDEDESEFLALYARMLQKKFSGVDDDFEAIIENLEGA